MTRLHVVRVCRASAPAVNVRGTDIAIRCRTAVPSGVARSEHADAAAMQSGFTGSTATTPATSGDRSISRRERRGTRLPRRGMPKIR